MGGGDIGLPFYRPQRILEVIRYTWWDAIAPGIAFSQTLSSLPLYLSLATLSYIGFSDASIQALLFFFVLLIGGASTYFLTSSMTEDKSVKRKASILSALFYMLNPYALVYVWHRFAITSILFSALLPLALLLTIKGIRSRQIFPWSFSIALLTVAFSYSFGSPALVVTLWLVLFSYIALHLIYSKGSNFFHTAKFVITLVALFVLLNLWWSVPYLYEYSIPTVLSSRGFEAGAQQNLGSYSVTDVVRLFSWFYLVWEPSADVPYETTHFGLIYTSPIFQVISFSIPFFTFGTLFLKRKDKGVMFFSFLAVVGIFISKGSAPPLGEPLQWLVGNFIIFGPLRTAFDKVGIVVALGYSYLFGIGVASLYKWVKGSRPTGSSINRNYRTFGFWRRVIALILVFVIGFAFFVMYPWPMWTGDVFRKGTAIPDFRVEVPKYYCEANEWLSTQPEGRIIGLPFQAVPTYDWPPYGYHGLESSELLFDRPVIGKWIGIDYFDQLIQNWRKLLSTNQYWKIMNLFGARYIVVRNDINHTAITSETENPADIKLALEYLEKPAQVKEETLISSSGDILSNSTEGWSIYEADSSTVIRTSQQSVILEGKPKNAQFLFFYEVPETSRDWSNGMFLEIWLNSTQKGKLLVAAHNSDGVGPNWDGRHNPDYSILDFDVNTWKRFLLPLNVPLPESFNYDDVRRIFIGLLDLQEGKPITIEIGSIRAVSVRSANGYIYHPELSRLRPYSSTPDAAVFLDSRDLIYDEPSFYLTSKPQSSENSVGLAYRVAESLTNWTNMKFLEVWVKSDVKGKLLIAAVDGNGKWTTWDGRFDEQYSISEIEVGKWKRVVLPLSNPTDSKANLADIRDIIIMILRVEPSTPVTLKAGGIRVSVSKLVRNEHIRYLKTIGKLDFYKLDDQYFLDKVYATNKFEFAPNVLEMLRLIDDESFIPGNVAVFLHSQSNLNDMNVLESLNTSTDLYKPNITIKRIDPTLYEITVTNASQPFFLIFSETYHPLWTAYVDNERIADNLHFIVNGYANAWYINKTGTYKIALKFTLQTIFEYCVVISTLTLVACLLYLSRHKIKRVGQKLTQLSRNLSNKSKHKQDNRELNNDAI